MREPSLEFHLLNPSTKRHSIWELGYYQPWFNVDSSDVVLRLQSALLLQPSTDFFELIQDRPDFYGPFWICTSALFFTFTASSVATLFALSAEPVGLHHIGLAAFFLYAILLAWPSLAYLALAHYASPNSSVPTWAQWVCIYGYALASILPFSVLAVVVLPLVRHHGWALWMWQWVLLLLALGLSSWFIVRNVWPFFSPLRRETKSLLLSVLFTLHALLFLILKLLFF